jgi:RNA polymerase sigma-70 factor (ECF subfamily)
MPLAPVFTRRVEAGEDLDAGLVARVQGGDVEAFEELVRRHSRCVYRVLVGILGDAEQARDTMQDAFLKAFVHIGEFQARSKFSTWLLSIARNTGVQRLRERKNVDSLDEDGRVEGDEFRPRQVRAWQDNPEQLYAEAEIRGLVEKGVMSLPAKYRVVVILRDLEQLSTEEVAQGLGLSVPALKARLVRGRLMLREFLSPHFTERTRGINL